LAKTAEKYHKQNADFIHVVTVVVVVVIIIIIIITDAAGNAQYVRCKMNCRHKSVFTYKL